LNRDPITEYTKLKQTPVNINFLSETLTDSIRVIKTDDKGRALATKKKTDIKIIAKPLLNKN